MQKHVQSVMHFLQSHVSSSNQLYHSGLTFPRFNQLYILQRARPDISKPRPHHLQPRNNYTCAIYQDLGLFNAYSHGNILKSR